MRRLKHNVLTCRSELARDLTASDSCAHTRKGLTKIACTTLSICNKARHILTLYYLFYETIRLEYKSIRGYRVFEHYTDRLWYAPREENAGNNYDAKTCARNIPIIHWYSWNNGFRRQWVIKLFGYDYAIKVC